MKKPFAASLAALWIVACGSDSKKEDDATGDGSGDGSHADGGGDGSGGDGCATFCSDAGYESGSALMFDGNVTECICSGGAGSITPDACDAYCVELEIPAEFAYDNASENKCVCDGTQVPSGDGASDGSDGSGGDGASDGSDGSSDGSDGSTGDDLFETDGEGFPVLPADPFATNAQGSIWVSVTDSDLTHLPNGEYVAPISYNASSGSSLTFFDPGYIFADEPVIQVQVNIRSEKMSGMFECEDVYGMIVRYGKPPSGANASVVISCASTYTYDAGTNSYTGTLEAELGGAYIDENMPTETGTFKARFAYVDEVP